MAHLTESDVESAALAWLKAMGWSAAHGPDVAPDMPAAERADHEDGRDAPSGRRELASGRAANSRSAKTTTSIQPACGLQSADG